jgi:hypothetical protein
MKTISKKVIRRLRTVFDSPAAYPNVELPKITLTTASRFLYQKRLFDIAGRLEGDIVECGVGRGETLLLWAILCHDEARHRRLWGFDSFEGFPEPTREDASPRNVQKGEWNVATMASIRDLLVSSGFSTEWVRSRVTLVKGYFEESLRNYTGKRIALLHIDADLYQSYKTALQSLYARVPPGGVIAFDEYMGSFEHHDFPGAKKAIDEFFADQPVEILRDEVFGKYYMVKPADHSSARVQ